MEVFSFDSVFFNQISDVVMFITIQKKVCPKRSGVDTHRNTDFLSHDNVTHCEVAVRNQMVESYFQ